MRSCYTACMGLNRSVLQSALHEAASSVRGLVLEQMAGADGGH